MVKSIALFGLKPGRIVCPLSKDNGKSIKQSDGDGDGDKYFDAMMKRF
jgi:hypothetical protein